MHDLGWTLTSVTTDGLGIVIVAPIFAENGRAPYGEMTKLNSTSFDFRVPRTISFFWRLGSNAAGGARSGALRPEHRGFFTLAVG